MGTERRSSTSPRTETPPSDWVLAASAGLMVVFIIGALAVPVWFESRLGELREQRERVFEPAQDHLEEVQLALAREIAAYRGFLLSRDPAFLTRRRSAIEDRQAALMRLDSVSRRMGAEVRDSLAALQRAVADWEASEADLPRALPNGPGGDLHLNQDDYEAVLRATAGVGEAVSAETDGLVAELRAVERWWGWAQMLLTALALAGLVVVLWGAHQVRYHSRSRGSVPSRGSPTGRVGR